MGCTSKQTEETALITLPNPKPPGELEVFQIPPVLWKERRLIATDNFIVSNSATPDTLFRVFDRETMTYLGGFGREGDGPDDFRLISSSTFNPSGDLLFVGGMKTTHIMELKREKGNQSQFSVHKLESFKVPGELMPWNWSFKLNDSIFAGVKSFYSENELTTYNVNTSEIESMIPFPDYAPHLESKYNHVLYQNRLQYSGGRNKVVIAYLFYPAFRIYDVETKEAIDFHIDTDFEQLKVWETGDGQNLNLPDLYTYYKKVLVTDNHIYAFYQIVSGPNTGSHVLSNLELHIFDFNGELIHNMRLEDWMWSCAISKDDQYMYFWHPEREDKLYRYSLEELF
ncbi:MAG: BF3164 family lipoprotein [Roseivirga sp.]